MRKGQRSFDIEKSPIYFVPTKTIQPPMEEFVDVTELMVPNVLPYYMISNYGRLFHKYLNRFLTVSIDTKGYLFKPIHLKDGTQKNVRIHRLVAMGFMYREGCESLLINHIDGNKCNPCIWNLEWVTHKGNMEHAAINGMVKTRSYTDEEVIKVCELLEKGDKSIPQISEMLNLPVSFIAAIQRKSSHTDISDKYNIKPRKLNFNLSNDQVRSLCNWYQNNPKYDILNKYCEDGLKAIGLENPSSREIRAAKKIYCKETYTYISKEYSF